MSTEFLGWGNAILERFAAIKVPASLRAPLNAFKSEHSAFIKAWTAADNARKARDAALERVAAADTKLDAAVETLARKMTGADMGSRRNPFEGFSKYTPSGLCDLAYAEEPKQVRTLLASVKKAKPDAIVTAAITKCAGACEQVEGALKQFAPPQAAMVTAIKARDDRLPGWRKALDRLRKFSAVAFIDDGAQVEALFAKPSSVEAPAKKRKSKKTTKKTEPKPTPEPKP